MVIICFLVTGQSISCYGPVMELVCMLSITDYYYYYYYYYYYITTSNETAVTLSLMMVTFF